MGRPAREVASRRAVRRGDEKHRQHLANTWFEPADVKIAGASAVTGGGAVTFDLSKGKTVHSPKKT